MPHENLSVAVFNHYSRFCIYPNRLLVVKRSLDSTTLLSLKILN